MFCKKCKQNFKKYGTSKPQYIPVIVVRKGCKCDVTQTVMKRSDKERYGPQIIQLKNTYHFGDYGQCWGDKDGPGALYFIP